MPAPAGRDNQSVWGERIRVHASSPHGSVECFSYSVELTESLRSAARVPCGAAMHGKLLPERMKRSVGSIANQLSTKYRRRVFRLRSKKRFEFRPMILLNGTNALL
jgi:hypothetical protein